MCFTLVHNVHGKYISVLSSMIIYAWDIHFKCVSKVHQKVYNFLLFESGEHGGGGRLDDGDIKYFTPFELFTSFLDTVL